MTSTFNPLWNSHYDFSLPGNLEEIARQQGLDASGIEELPPYNQGGGDTIQSPWGTNKTLDAGLYHAGLAKDFLAERFINPERLLEMVSAPLEFCQKDIVVNPAHMLSLQRHRGRQECWAVAEGALTVILDGKIYELMQGQNIYIPRGSAHCMINRSSAPVRVIELQSGICREGDNVRLLDFSGRPVYPLTSETEFVSAQLYASIQRDIQG